MTISLNKLPGLVEASEEALSGLVDQLFTQGQRDAALLVSQASATVGTIGQQLESLAAENERLRAFIEIQAEQLEPFAPGSIEYARQRSVAGGAEG